MTAYGSSIGGLGTPIGTPPNLIGIGLLEKLTGNGVLFAALAAVGWATYIVLTQRIGDRYAGIGGLSLTIPIAAATAALPASGTASSAWRTRAGASFALSMAKK